MDGIDEKIKRLEEIAKEIGKEDLPFERVEELRTEGVKLGKTLADYIETLRRPKE